MTDRLRFLGAASELLLFLVVLHLLYVWRLAPLNFFGFGPFYPDDRQTGLFALYFVVFVAHALAPEPRRQSIRVAGGLLSGLVAFPTILPGLLVLTGMVFLVVHHLRGRAWIKVSALGALYVALGLWSAHSAYGQLLSVVFVGMTFFRTLLYLHAMAQKRYPRGSFVDYLHYQLPLPSFLIPPYLGVIPPFGGRHSARPLDTVIADGRKLLRAGLATLLVARAASVAATHLFGGDLTRVPGTLFAWHAWAMSRMVIVLLDTSASAAFLIGLMMLLGWDVKPAMNRPWFSESLFDYWNRFIIHFKDLQVALFFYPTVLALRRRPRRLAIVVATMMTFLVGNNVMHMLGRYLYTAERHTLLPHAVRANLALTLVMALAFLWEDYKQACRRRGAPVPLASTRWPARALRIYLTLGVISWIWHL